MTTFRQPGPIPEASLPRRIQASEVKQRGWRGVMRTVREQGTVVVTNHNEPEAFILGVEQYRTLLEAAGRAGAREEEALESLRRRFDDRLAALAEDDAGERLRAVMRKPVKLGGKVKAGTTF